MNRIFLPAIAGVLAAASFLAAADSPPKVWDLKELSRSPAEYPAPGLEAPGVRALFYQGLPWKGKPTRVFAWYGAPARGPGERAPAMVLVHGGGGTAFDAWVRLWTARGYAAIAMDTCGATPGGKDGKHPRHEQGGPPGWGGFDQIDEPIGDQWTFHAVADLILAHSLIRSYPEIDPERVGITGISWGGYLTCIGAGVDSRFRLAVPVYGCGFLGENSCWLGTFKGMGDEKARRWLDLWDPSRWLPSARSPMLWVTGTNDFAYPLDSLAKSCRAAAGKSSLCVRIRMPHGHGGAGENPEEIRAFADSILAGGPPLAEVTGRRPKDGRAFAAFQASPAAPVTGAELVYTRDGGPWKERAWVSAPAEVDAKAGEVSAPIPEGTRVFYFNLTDKRGLVTSSPHEERAP